MIEYRVESHLTVELVGELEDWDCYQSYHPDAPYTAEWAVSLLRKVIHQVEVVQA